MNLFLRHTTFFVYLLLATHCTLLDTARWIQPQIEMQGLDLKDIQKDGAIILFNLKVTNPNPFKLKVENIKYKIKFDDADFTDGQIDQKIEIAEKNSEQIQIPVQFRFKNILATLQNLLKKENTRYQIQGTAQLGIFTLPFEESGEFLIEKNRIVHKKK